MTAMKRLLLLLAFVGAVAQAQDKEPVDEAYIAGVPASVYYLMPSFADGMVYFYSRVPAQGKLNICAIDHTLRFLDKNGQELQAEDNQGVSKVRIDTVWFLRSYDYFYRMYPLTADSGLAVKREVKILRDAKEGAYGMVSQTGAIREINKLYGDGVSVDINKNKKVHYEIIEELYLYKGGTVAAYNKKNLKKIFPALKPRIDDYFTTHKTLPHTLDQARVLIMEWSK